MTQDQADIQAQELERIVEQQNEVLREKFEQQARTIQENTQKLSNLEAKELANKGDLREVECKWHNTRKCWYFAGSPSRYRKNSGKGIDDIAEAYGATKIRNKTKTSKRAIAA